MEHFEREPAHMDASLNEGDLLCFALEQMIHELNTAPEEIEFTELGEEAVAGIKSEAAKLLFQIGVDERCQQLALDDVQVHICQMALDMLRLNAREWLERPDIRAQEPEKWHSVQKMSVAADALFEKIEGLTMVGRPGSDEHTFGRIIAGFKS